MDILKKRILKDGVALNQSVLKVDSFLNHGVDPKLMADIGREFAEYFRDKGITKVFTIESSGIAPAVMTALEMNLPMVILKKQQSRILNEDLYHSKVHSFTKDKDYELTLSKKYISKEDKVLIIDDFLAYGEATRGAAALLKEAGAEVKGIGIVIEKSYQPGRKILDEEGYDVYSLARILRMDKDLIEFVDE